MLLVRQWKYVVGVLVAVVVGVGGYLLVDKPASPEFEALVSTDLSKGAQVVGTGLDGGDEGGYGETGLGDAGLAGGDGAAGDAGSMGGDNVPRVLVDVKGAVVNPGVYALADDARVIDAVEAAGGFLAEADTLQVNLAAPVRDAMAILIPRKGQPVSQSAVGASAVGTVVIPGDQDSGSSGPSQATKININTGSLSQLMTLTGIGEVKAREIIAYRDRTGGFKKIEDLMKVSGIGAVTFAKIKDFITI